MPLWSDDKTNEDIQKLAETNSDSVVYNLHEDLLCVKEQLAKANERVKKSCRWVRKSDLSLQLQTDLWLVGCVSESDIKKGMFYWKVTTCPKSISGYSENEKEAVETVEALISSCSNYEYRLINSDKQLRKEQEW